MKIKEGLIGGIFVALLMAGFDYLDGLDFRVFRFVINTLVSGFLLPMLIIKIKK